VCVCEKWRMRGAVIPFHTRLHGGTWLSTGTILSSLYLYLHVNEAKSPVVGSCGQNNKISGSIIGLCFFSSYPQELISELSNYAPRLTGWCMWRETRVTCPSELLCLPTSTFGTGYFSENFLVIMETACLPQQTQYLNIGHCSLT
jgi:hypothetical protein